MALLDNFLLLLFSFCVISVYSSEFIPVYMWESAKNYSPLPALGRVNEEFFRDILLDKFNKNKSIIVFQEENLSPEDFTTFDSAGENVYRSLSHLKSKAQVNYYPFVEAPMRALQSLPGVKVSKVDITDNGLLSNVKVEPNQVLIVDLNDAKENEDRSHMLRRHDTLVASIYKSVLEQNDNVISLYTARHTSWLVPSELDSNGIGRKARHLMAANQREHFFASYKNTLIYLEYPVIFTKDNTPTTISSISGSESEQTLKLSGGGVTITFSFSEDNNYWAANKVTVESGGKFDYDTSYDIYAPFGFSYHCNGTNLITMTASSQIVSLQIPALQIQRVHDQTSIFGEAYDCAGFTTAPIWSGLFVTFILALIMTFGLCMIMDIKTMDRFDDPKGKTISINVVE